MKEATAAAEMGSDRLRVVPAGMEPHIAAIFAGEYEPPDGVDPGPVATVLDIGANIGGFTAWALDRFPEARIVAVEPMPANVELFRENLPTHWKWSRVQLIPAACWPEGDHVDLLRGLHNCGECSQFDLGEQDPAGEPVRVETVHPNQLPAAEFIKIDTEGAEWEILTGLDLGGARVIALEWHLPGDRLRILKFLVEKGFRCVKDRHRTADRGVLIFAAPAAIRQPADPASKPRQKKKVFVGLPVYGGYHPHFVPCLLNLIQSPPVSLMVQPLAGDSLVSRARNALAAAFLRSDCTHLLFLDTDLVFSPEQIGRLIGQADTDHEIVAGLYPKKQPGLAWVCNMFTGPEATEPDEASGLQRVRYAGTGCLLIARSVLEWMIARHPEIAYQVDESDPPRVEHDFFSVGVYRGSETSTVEPGRYLSEDWWFCQRAMDLGYDIWMDTGVVLKHCGEAVYPLEDLEADDTEPEVAELIEQG